MVCMLAKKQPFRNAAVQKYKRGPSERVANSVNHSAYGNVLLSRVSLETKKSTKYVHDGLQ